MVCQRYRFRPVPGRPVEPWVQLALRPRDGVWMTLGDVDARVRPKLALVGSSRAG